MGFFDEWDNFMSAATKGNERQVAYEIAHGIKDDRFSVNVRDGDKRTALSRATENGHADVVKLLIEVQDIDLNLADGAGRAPLHFAASNRRTAILEALVDAGADVNARGENERTALSYVAEIGDIHAVNKLLSVKGIEIDATSTKGLTALLRAAKNKQTAVVEALVDAGANVNLRDEYGRTALSYAAEQGDIYAVRKLLAVEGIEVDTVSTEGKTALWYATAGRNPLVVADIVAAGANVDAHCRDYVYPLYLAVKNDDRDSVTALVKADANLDVQDRQNLWTPLHYAVYNNYAPIVALLAEAGANADVPAKDGRTARSMAKDSNNSALLTEMLERKPKPVEPQHVESVNPIEAQPVKEIEIKDSETWQLTATNKLVHTEVSAAISRSLTEIFNFESRERMDITQNLKTNVETFSKPISFDELSSNSLLNAFKKFSELGGVADEKEVFTPDRLKVLSEKAPPAAPQQ